MAFLFFFLRRSVGCSHNSFLLNCLMNIFIYSLIMNHKAVSYFTVMSFNFLHIVSNIFLVYSRLVFLTVCEARQFLETILNSYFFPKQKWKIRFGHQKIEDIFFSLILNIICSKKILLHFANN